jgi:hypothetical protein
MRGFAARKPVGCQLPGADPRCTARRKDPDRHSLARDHSMFGLFRKSPLKKLQQEHEELQTRAFQAQRNGDIRGYSALTAEAEALREKIDQLKREQGD